LGVTSPVSRLHLNGDSIWIGGSDSGGLGATAGAGLRLFNTSSESNIYAYDYATTQPRTLALQAPGGAVGVGTSTPEATLHVMTSSAGAVTANSNSIAVFERSGGGWVSILGADGSSKGILFGNTTDASSGGIVYDQASVASNAMQFRTGGNVNRM